MDIDVVYYDRSRGIIEVIDSDPCEAFRVVRRSSACGRCSSAGEMELERYRQDDIGDGPACYLAVTDRVGGCKQRCETGARM